MRLCCFLRQSGLTEKSISLLQAFMELGFKRSKHFQQPQKNADASLSSLETHWNSRAPRIGEEGIEASNDQLRKVLGTDCK